MSTTSAEDFKAIVDEAINAFQRYAFACQAAIDQPLDKENWRRVAIICEENAIAWQNLAALYRVGNEHAEGDAGSADRPTR